MLGRDVDTTSERKIMELGEAVLEQGVERRVGAVDVVEDDDRRP